ncbi:MAG: DUF2254 domain-containing protein [Actinomycetota bacterium]
MDTGEGLIKIQARLEELRGSLFYVPSLFVIAAIGLAFGTLQLDRYIEAENLAIPDQLRATVDSARALLGTVASATITFAGVAFSVSLLMIQLASSQFSPRVLYGFFRDPFSKRVMGISIGTFTYCLLVLRAARTEAEPGGSAIVPTVSVLVAVFLGVIAVLAVIAFINHSAHSMEVGEIIRRISESTHDQIVRLCPERGKGKQGVVEGPMPDEESIQIEAAKSGWIQNVDGSALIKLVRPGGIVRVDRGAGEFVTFGTPICTVWMPTDREKLARKVREAVGIGRSRTMQQDIAFGFRQIVDIALRALSPGVNDPTTAVEAIVHLGPILRTLLLRDLPSRVRSDDEGRRVVRPQDMDHADFIALAFAQIRMSAATMPFVSESIIETLGMLVSEVEEAGLGHRAVPLRKQAELVLAGCERAAMFEDDVAQLRATAERLDLVSLSE